MNNNDQNIWSQLIQKQAYNLVKKLVQQIEYNKLCENLFRASNLIRN